MPPSVNLEEVLQSTFRWIVFASLALKLALALAFGDLQPRYDESEFLRYGAAIAGEGTAPVLWRAPGYQWFVATGLLLAGGRAVGVRLLQVALSVLASVLVYRIARLEFDERVATWAGAFVAFYPSHVAFSHLLWSETLYGFLALLAFERLLAWKARPGTSAAVAAGLALGAASLTRSVGLALLAVSLAWVLARRNAPRRWRDASALLAAAACVVVPWSAVASARAHRFVVVDTNAGFNLWSGNNSYIPAGLPGLWSVGLPPENGLDVRVARFRPGGAWRYEVPPRMTRAGVDNAHGPAGDAWYREQAFAYVARRPWEAALRVPLKLAAFWAPDFFLPRHVLRDWYGPAPAAVGLLLWALTWAAAVVPLLLGPAALGAGRAGPFRSLAVAWLVTYIAVHAVTYGHSRMHQPLVPFLVIATASVLLARGEERAPRRLLARGGPWLTLAAAAWLVSLPVVAGVYMMPSPRHAAAARVLGAVRHVPLPANREPAWMLAGVEASNGNLETARTILAGGPWADLPWTLYLRGLYAATPQTGTKRLRQAVAARPTLFPAWFTLAETLLAQGRTESAREAAERARTLRPDSPRVGALLRRLE